MSTSQIPMHTGIVNPIRDEYVYDSLEVLGTIPAELDGTLYRNSVNPRFRALNPAAFHVFDGDGMMHAFTLRDGKASYRNKWVRTEGLEFEMKADRALYNGFFGESGLPQCELPVDAPVLKIASAVNAIALGDRVYALQETADHWYELIPETLDVREVWDFDGQVKGRGLMTAHPHTDPRNGDLLFYTYDSVTLNLDVCRATRDGSFVQRHSVALDAPAYIHDFIFTEDYYVFMLGPVGWHTNLADYVSVGRSSWTFDAEIGGRVLVISRTDGSARWFSDDTSQLNHFLNAYQDGDRIIVDASVCEITGALTDRLVSEVYPFARGAGANPFVLSTIWRWTIDQRTGKVTHEPIGDVGNADMPRPNEEFLGRPYRYGYLLATAKGQPDARYNTTIKHDFETGTETIQRLTGEAYLSASEPIFVPRAGSVAEDDGWVLTVWGNRREGTSELLIQDATAFDAEPVARVKLNHYLPTTIHGNWIPASVRSDERQGR